MDQIYRYTDPMELSLLGIAGLPAIIGVVLILIGIRKIFIAKSEYKVPQSVMSVVLGALWGLLVLLNPLALLSALPRSLGPTRFMKGRRARPGEIAYEEPGKREKGPDDGSLLIGIGIALIGLVYFAWDILLDIASLLLFFLTGMYVSI
jgi:hypothetical protein